MTSTPVATSSSTARSTCVSICRTASGVRLPRAMTRAAYAAIPSGNADQNSGSITELFAGTTKPILPFAPSIRSELVAADVDHGAHPALHGSALDVLRGDQVLDRDANRFVIGDLGFGPAAGPRAAHQLGNLGDRLARQQPFFFRDHEIARVLQAILPAVDDPPLRPAHGFA